MRVKYNNKHWIVTKSLQDFAALNEELAQMYPTLRVPDSTALLEDSDEKETKEERISRKQRYLEAYLRVSIREVKTRLGAAAERVDKGDEKVQELPWYRRRGS